MNDIHAVLPEDADAGDIDEILRFHVKEALRSKLQHGRGRAAAPYQNLVNQVRSIKGLALGGKDEEQAEHLTSILDALTACVSTLHERKHEALLNEVLNIPIWTASPELRAAVLHLVTHVVVANSTLVPLCLRVLTMGLQPPPTPPAQPEPGTRPPGLQPDWEPSPEVTGIQAEVIKALEKVLTLVPTAPSRLVSLIAGGIPHRLRDREVQCLYLRGALALAEAPAAAAVREGILTAAVEHLLGLDVEIRWQDIVDEDAEGAEEEVGESENEEEDIFELEGQTEHLHLGTPRHAEQEAAARQSRGGWEGAATGARAVASTSGRHDASETRLKLDSLMGLVLQHLQRRCSAGQLAPAWNTMLHTFNRSILDTYRSKFTQFLVFFLCEKDPDHCIPGLLSILLDRLTSPKYAPISRSSACAYLASFLARAAYIPEATVVESLQALAKFCVGYCREQDARDRRSTRTAPHVLRARLDNTPRQPQPLHHQVFYAACQALLYVLCYRLGQLMSGQPPNAAGAGHKAAAAQPGPHAEAVRQLFKEAIPTILHHRLAPLQVCLPTVVDEFTRQAQKFGLMDCKGLLPGELKRAQRPLEMFFPFDPFLLRRSAQYLDLDRTYVRWQQVHGDSDDDEESDVSSDEEVEGVSELGGASNEDEASSSTSSDSGSDTESSSSEDAAAHKRMAVQRQSSMALWLSHAPVGMRPISAGASRKRAASNTPGSDQGYLHGGSFDTNGTVSPPALEGMSPAVAPMSWVAT